MVYSLIKMPWKKVHTHLYTRYSLENFVRGIAMQKSLYRSILLETMKVTDIGSFSGRST